MKGTLYFLLALLLSVAQAANPPFSNVKKVGDILYLSGQTGSVKPGEPPLVEGGVEPETRQAMENIKQILTANCSSLSNVFKCTVMMADMSEWPIMNEIYASYFENGEYPARSAFGATGLALNARVEIECMATVSKKCIMKNKKHSG
ncbi:MULTISPECIES: RidA family protein [Legionella]|uniref:RidA family protein n=1 Tax=Legionella resiliens TaxID=2905958 RepID=A0ABS8X8C8_9GAMM|nr:MULTISPECIES: RidA family protein [unclassified Legionella]MCE0723782.1 RidA family protein [Legionella sp. 9fVS26]MCE3532934.1 RidA family protein [Legionella sp. 8cVS16]QLZ69123.1 2-iminobutanoate/2-iminopropanoate deaminase [Legionella sp. PC1000]